MDLISRQAAIDRINKQREHLKPDIDERDAVGDAAYRVCAEFIERLQSAHPDIVRCKDCKYQRKGQNECEAWNLCGYRPWQYTPITDEYFCSYAERRTNE